MNKRKQYTKKTKNRRGILVLFLIIVPIAMCLVGVGGQYYILAMIGEGAGDAKITVEDAVGSSMLDTIMSTISIAVSVWIGLNIYNVYKREDIDEALKKVEDFIAEMTYEGKRRKFLWQLEKGEYMYEICRYLSVEFEQENDIPLEIMERLTEFEKQFYWCYSAYEKNKKKECLQIAKKLLEELQDIHRYFIKQNVSEQTLLYSYFNIRMADLLFYKNKVSEKANAVEYLRSIELYKRELKKIPYKDVALQGYMQNTIGYTYSLLCQMPENVNSGKQELVFKKLRTYIYEKVQEAIIGKKPANEKEYWSEQAERYLLEAVENNRKGRYLQNLGAYYEMVQKEYDKALRRYREALVAEKQDAKIYNLLGAVSLKMVDEKLHIDKRFENNLILRDIAEKFLTSDDEDKVREVIIEAYNWLNFALRVPDPIINTYYNYSKACTYYFLFVERDDGKLKEADKYLKTVKTFLVGEAEDKESKRPVGYLFTSRNYYEAMGDLNSAKEKNNELKKINPDMGDVRAAERVYNRIN